MMNNLIVLCRPPRYPRQAEARENGRIQPNRVFNEYANRYIEVHYRLGEQSGQRAEHALGAWSCRIWQKHIVDDDREPTPER